MSLTHEGRHLRCDLPGCAAVTRAPVGLRQTLCPAAGEGALPDAAGCYRGPVTMAVFAFDANAELADHQANGLVTIHCLDGALSVRTPEHAYELVPNGIVVLAPGVRHSVRAANVASAMLLSVCREGAGSPAGDE